MDARLQAAVVQAGLWPNRIEPKLGFKLPSAA